MPGEGGKVGDHVLCLGVLQGQPERVKGGQTGELLADVDDEGRLESGQSRARQCRG